MSIIKNFNTESLLHFTEDDKPLSIELLSMALQDIPVFFSKASVLIDQKQFQEAAVWVHKIKGISGSVGAERLYDICISTEEKLKQSNPVINSKKLIDSLATSIEEFCRNSEVINWITDV